MAAPCPGAACRPRPLPVARLHLGAILATVATFTMFGLLFTLPQFFGAVYGTDAFGTGLRLLPVIGGLMVGARVAGRLAERIGAKVVVAAGLALMAAALGFGATTSVDTGYGYVAAWVCAAGLGLGFAMPPAMNAALGALDTRRSGVGSGLIQAMRQVGSAIGVAVLGTVLNAAYRDGLPADATDAVRNSASGGVEVAGQLGSTQLLDSVRTAFVQGMDSTLALSAVLAAAGAVLALVFLPARPPDPPQEDEAAPLPAESTV
ncbi:MFS transporter [Phytohabitans flavus]|uniref:MFS transporter n=1 Tax=Phytohabitans flavus TaxID=1076124 RepID=UPI0036326DAC